MSSPSIFISYRREDTEVYAGRLADRLIDRFGAGSVFMDIDLPAGVDFVDHIEAAVRACDVLLVVIGPGWLEATDARGRRRLDDENDFVHLEVAAGLQRGVAIIPVLVNGAVMPAGSDLPPALAALARRNAYELIGGARWKPDVTRLEETIEEILDRPPVIAPPVATPIATAPSPAVTTTAQPQKPVVAPHHPQPPHPTSPPVSQPYKAAPARPSKPRASRSDRVVRPGSTLGSRMALALVLAVPFGAAAAFVAALFTWPEVAAGPVTSYNWSEHHTLAGIGAALAVAEAAALCLVAARTFTAGFAGVAAVVGGAIGLVAGLLGVDAGLTSQLIMMFGLLGLGAGIGGACLLWSVSAALGTGLAGATGGVLGGYLVSLGDGYPDSAIELASKCAGACALACLAIGIAVVGLDRE